MNVIIIILAVFAIRTTIRMWTDVGAPESPAYLAYLRDLRRNLTVGIAIPLIAAVVAVVVSVVYASGPGSPVPARLQLPLDAIGGYGIIVGPLLALLVTECAARRRAVRTATLVARSLNDVVARPLSVCTAVVSVGAIVGCAIAASTDTTRATVSIVAVAVGAVITVATVRLSLHRPDVDDQTPSDQWSREGIATRAVALQTALGFSALAAASAILRNRFVLDGSPTATTVADFAAIVFMCATVASFSLFSRPQLARPLPLPARP